MSTQISVSHADVARRLYADSALRAVMNPDSDRPALLTPDHAPALSVMIADAASDTAMILRRQLSDFDPGCGPDSLATFTLSISVVDPTSLRLAIEDLIAQQVTSRIYRGIDTPRADIATLRAEAIADKIAAATAAPLSLNLTPHPI